MTARVALPSVAVRTREPVLRHWVFFLVVYPCAVIAATVGVEQVGVTGLVVLVLFAIIWTSALLRCVWRSRWLIPRMLGFLGVIAVALLLLRPAVPDRIPDDLAEVLLRELLKDPYPGWVYFVEVDGKDASPDLLHRLADLGVRLKPGSKAMVGGRDYPREEYDISKRNSVKDRDSGEYGTLLSVAKLSREGSYVLSLSVDIGSHTGGLSGHGKRCLVLRLGGWKITGSTMIWVA